MTGEHHAICPVCGIAGSAAWFPKDLNILHGETNDAGYYMQQHQNPEGGHCCPMWEGPVPGPEELTIDKAVARLIALEELLQ